MENYAQLAPSRLKVSGGIQSWRQVSIGAQNPRGSGGESKTESRGYRGFTGGGGGVGFVKSL